jgi:methionyl-tRNA formyltransferase
VRTVYLGTSGFAVAVLERLARSDHRPALVVTRPDRPRGRGRKLAAPPIADAARDLGIDLAQPESVNSADSLERIALAEPEVVCICAFGALIKEPLLSEYPMLNVHPSLLPRWRGAAPIERAIDAGDETTGVSIMRPTAELDAGPVCLRRTVPIGPDDDFGSLSARLAELAGELLVEALTHAPPFEDQPDEGVTFAEKIEGDDRRLPPERPPRELERRVRALSPHVGAYLELAGGERLGVLAARAEEEPAWESRARGTPTEEGAPRPREDSPPPGELRARGDRLLLGCAGGALELLAVKPAGGRRMAAADYLRGHRPLPALASPGGRGATG